MMSCICICMHIFVGKFSRIIPRLDAAELIS